ncbi:MAG: SCO family protein [Caldilineaceae bacterium]|nr:SCO family protein [Caldilineaceae bacterium]MCB9138868.1 SCO family protein [Caldilineaceae bacterium]
MNKQLQINLWQIHLWGINRRRLRTVQHECRDGNFRTLSPAESLHESSLGFARRFVGPVLALLLIAILSAGCRSESFNATEYDPPREAPAINGINKDGSEFSIADLKGKVTLVFFGYTFCPDICPLALANMMQVYQALPDDQENIAVVFVSVDPERDTPERLAEYVTAFNPDFYGVHVSEADLPAVKQAYGVYAEKNYLTDEESSIDYLIDHTGWVYIIDKQGRLRLTLSHTAPSDEIVHDVTLLLKERG